MSETNGRASTLVIAWDACSLLTHEYGSQDVEGGSTPQNRRQHSEIHSELPTPQCDWRTTVQFLIVGAGEEE